jgi:WD40 repeat protein
MSVIFISHSSKDNAIAEALRIWLESNGYTSLFLDFDPTEGIPAGKEWEQELYRKLRACRALVVICSSHSLSSCWCFAEIAFARSEGKPIFPIRVDAVKLPPQLADVQVIDLHAGEEEWHLRMARGLSRAGLDPSTIHSWDPQRSPFPGLSSFEERDAAIFFGRENLIWEGLDRMRAMRVHRGPSMLLILGISGSGKSSLLRAGLLPRLRKNQVDWCVLSAFRPAPDPVSGLALSLSEAFTGRHPDGALPKYSSAGLRQTLATATDPVTTLRDLLADLRRSLDREEATVVMPIDQLEELLIGDAPSDPSNVAFLLILRGLLQGAAGAVLLVTTLRSDLLGLLQARTELVGLSFEQLLMSPMGPEAYAQAIEGPAALAGLRLESGLTQRIVADTGTDDALPLLAFTLQQLWERYGREDGVLTNDDYQKGLGGLAGAVQREADSVLRAAALDELSMGRLHRAFLEMARIDDQGRVVRRPARWTSIPPDLRPVLERFVKARLLVEGREEGSVEVAHEALLRHWSVLANWLAEDQDFMLWRRRLEAALEEFQRTGEVLGSASLAEALRWKDRIPPATPEAALIARSEDVQRQAKEREREGLRKQAADEARLRIKEEEIAILGSAVEEGNVQKSRLIRQGRRVFWAFLALAGLSGVGAIWGTNRLRVATAAAQLEQASAVLRGQHADDQLTALRSALVNGFRLRQLVVGRRDLASYPTLAPLNTLEDLLGSTWERRRQSAHRYGVVSVVSLDGKGGSASIGKDDRLRIWGPAGERQGEHPLAGGTAITASQDGRAIFAGTADGEVVRFDPDGRAVARWSAHPIGGVNALAIGPDPDTLVSAGGDGMITVWSLQGRRLAGWRAAPQEEGVQDLAVDHAGRRIMSVGEGKALVRQWSVDGSPLPSLAAPANGPLVKVVVAEGGNLLLAAGIGNDLWLWRGRKGNPNSGPIRLKGLSLPVRSLAFLQDLKDPTLVAGDSGGTIHLWNVRGEPLTTLRGHDGDVTHLAASGKGLLSSGVDGTLRAWRRPPSIHARSGGFDSSIHAIRIHPGGREAALAMANGSVRIVGLDGAPIRAWSTRRGSLSSLDISPNGSQLVVGGSTGLVRMWSWMGERGALRQAEAPSIVSVRMEPRRGEWILAGSSDGQLWLWPSAVDVARHWMAHPDGAVAMVSFHPTGRSIASVGTDGWARTWRLNGLRQAETQVSKLALRAVSFTPDGRQLLVASDDGNVSFIRASGGIIRSFPTYQNSISALAFSPNGDVLATAGADGSLKIWDLSGRLRSNFVNRPEQPIYGLAWALNGRLLLSGGADGSLMVHKVENLDGLLQQGCTTLSIQLTQEPTDNALQRSCKRFVNADVKSGTFLTDPIVR